MFNGLDVWYVCHSCSAVACYTPSFKRETWGYQSWMGYVQFSIYFRSGVQSKAVLSLTCVISVQFKANCSKFHFKFRFIHLYNIFQGYWSFFGYQFMISNFLAHDQSLLTQFGVINSIYAIYQFDAYSINLSLSYGIIDQFNSLGIISVMHSSSHLCCSSI